MMELKGTITPVGVLHGRLEVGMVGGSGIPESAANWIESISPIEITVLEE